MKYDKLLQNAFATAWKYKYLWVLGLFVGGSSFPHSFGGDYIQGERLDHLAPGFALGLVLLLVFFLLIFVLALVVLNRISEGGLIANAARIERGEPHNLSIAWGSGLQYFWRMLGVMICYTIIGTLLILVLGVIGVAAGFICLGGIGHALGIVLFVLCLLVLVPILFCGLFIIAVAGSYSARFIVLEDQEVFASIESGFRLFREQTGKSIAMGAIALAVGIAIAIGTSIVFLILVLPLIGLGMASIFLALIPGVLIVLPLALLVNAYFGTFRSCLWTFFFLELRGLQSVPEAAANANQRPPPATPAA